MNVCSLRGPFCSPEFLQRDTLSSIVPHVNIRETSISWRVAIKHFYSMNV
jgi:hypothetical protein